VQKDLSSPSVFVCKEANCSDFTHGQNCPHLSNSCLIQVEIRKESTLVLSAPEEISPLLYEGNIRAVNISRLFINRGYI